MSGWIGVDLDGTLAIWNPGQNAGIGQPVPMMAKRVRQWLAECREVRIVTARVASTDDGKVLNEARVAFARAEIEDWCRTHFGQVLPVTAQKDYDMIELWDDRAVQVIRNTGIRVGKQSTTSY